MTSAYQRLVGVSTLSQLQNDVKTTLKSGGGGGGWSCSTSITSGSININCQGATGATIVWTVSCDYLSG